MDDDRTLEPFHDPDLEQPSGGVWSDHHQEAVVEVLAAGLHPRVRSGAAGVHYTDLKPDNFLVRRGADASPELVIGDLGGLARPGAPRLVVTPNRVPPRLLAAASWETVDVLTSYLVGVFALELLLRPPAAGSAGRPLDELFACLQRQTGEDCTAAFLPKLRASLADGLALEQPETLALAALALNLTGYRGLFVSLQEARAAPALTSALLLP